MDNEVMTLSEVASYLKLAEKTVLRMIHRNEIPCAKVGSQWRFMRPMIDDWLVSKMRVVPHNDLARLAEQDDTLIPVSRLVRPEFVVLGIAPGTKASVLEQLVQPLTDRGVIANSSSFLEGLVRRERILSTAVGNGVALPHLRNPSENPIPGPAIIVGVCPEGTDFASADGNLTHLLFVLSTDSEVVHLRLMAKLADLLTNETLVKRLTAATSPDDVLAALISAERSTPAH